MSATNTAPAIHRPPAMIGIALGRSGQAAQAPAEIDFRQIAEAAAQGIWTADREGCTTYVNPRMAEMLGLSPAEVVGRNAADFTLRDQTTAVAATLAAGLAGRTFEEEFRHVWPDGSSSWIDAAISPLLDALGAPNGFLALLHDNTALRGAEEVARRAARHAQTLSAADRVLVRSTTSSELLEEMWAVVADQGDYPLVWVGLKGQDPEEAIRVAASCNRFEVGVEEPDLDALVRSSPIQQAISMKEIQVSVGASPFRSERHGLQHRTERATAHLVVLPLMISGEVLGVLVIHGANTLAFERETLEVLVQLADELAFGLSTARVRDDRQAYSERLERSLGSAVRAIASAAELRDPYTAGHQERVACLTRSIAEALSLSQEEIGGIEMAAAIHDIGKIAVPAEILTRPGRLGPNELALVQQHAQAGHDIVAGIEFPWPVPQMILQHHERLDGSGYPAGLRGDEIILGARIIAVADVVDAMSTHRPYRAALGLETALAVLRDGAGVLFDPLIVDACLRAVDDGHIEYR